MWSCFFGHSTHRRPTWAVYAKVRGLDGHATNSIGLQRSMCYIDRMEELSISAARAEQVAHLAEPYVYC